MPSVFSMHRILFVFTVCAFLTGGCSDESSPDFFIIDTDGDGLADFSERSIGTSPTIADTDGDGLRDGSERANGTSPLLADTDSDGLCDGWSSTVGCVGGERFAGTDPTNPDTDGDGLLDGREDLNGDGIISLVRINGLRETNPFDVDTDDDGVNDGVEDINHNGKLNLDLGETDPGDPDTDGNGECDFPRVDNDGDGLNPADGCFWKVMYVKRKRDLPEGQENAPRDGTSWRNAFARIQHAIDAASEGTGIWVSQGSHFSIGSEPVAIMRQGISLFGGFSGTETKVEERSADAELTILDGSGLSNPVVLGATNTIIDGFVIANGRSGDPDNDEFANGAGYSIENADYVRLENVVFRNNQSVYGGGVYSRGSRLVLRNSIFENNSADLGGALYSNTNESLEIFNTVFSNNNAKTGGAIYNLAADLQIDASRFTDNNALTTGGCIFMAESQVGIERSAFKGNMAKTGGCITNDQAELIVFDSVFESNLAVISGGAVFNSTVINSDINNNVFIDNKATIGGAIYNAGSFLEITENVFAKNVAQNLAINDANDGVDSVGSGGAVYNVAESSVYYENNAFIANIAETGGAFYSLFSKPVVVDSLFAYNQAASSGGAIYEDSAGGFFYNLSVLGNSADSGGGAFIELSQTQIINSLVSENTGIEPGAGIYSAGSYTQLVSSSFIDNTTLTGSAAVYHSNELDSSSVIQIYNSLFWGNTGPYQDFFTTENSLIKIESNCTEQDLMPGALRKTGISEMMKAP